MTRQATSHIAICRQALEAQKNRKFLPFAGKPIAGQKKVEGQVEFGPLKQLQACNTNLPPPTMQATLWAKKNKCGGHFIHDS
jgi:hypothetical protein